jgi:hypothetical protein
MANPIKLVTDRGVELSGYCHRSNLPVVTEGPASSAAMNIDSEPVFELHSVGCFNS